jgi:hypothetical protein
MKKGTSVSPLEQKALNNLRKEREGEKHRKIEGAPSHTCIVKTEE